MFALVGLLTLDCCVRLLSVTLHVVYESSVLCSEIFSYDEIVIMSCPVCNQNNFYIYV